MSQRFFSIAPLVNSELPPLARKIAESVMWLVDARNDEGTWGGADKLDRFICTTHSVMALMTVGISADSPVIAPALKYLENLDKEQHLSFFWRSGVFCNIPQYASIVSEDATYIWKFRKRVAVHPNYPVLFFLLKLLRFSKPTVNAPVKPDDVLRIILEDWDDKDCWYGKTSITSMSLALIHDMAFPNRERIVSRCVGFLRENFDANSTGDAGFSDNLVEDLFTVFNLCESSFLAQSEAAPLSEAIEHTCARISALLDAQAFVESPPPFGGAIDLRIYPTAVCIRALMCFMQKKDPNFMSIVAPALIDVVGNRSAFKRDVGHFPISFWGAMTIQQEPRCFVLMPFQKKLTEIYERYVKKAIIEECKMDCQRADDVYQSSQIMRDICQKIASSELIIADMTHRNPNVFYELGLAHAIGKKVILISQSLDDIPSDLRPVRTIIYEDSPHGYEILSETLVRFVKAMRAQTA